MTTTTPIDPLAPPPARRTTLTTAAHHTTLLIRLRWRLLRHLPARIGISLALLAFIGIVLLASNTGTALWVVAESGYGTTPGEFAITYLIQTQRGELGTAGSLVFTAAVAASLLSPFTGTATLSLIPADDLTTLRPNPLHRWWDSLVLHVVSTIGLLQIILLTALTSVATVIGPRGAALAITWTVWLLLCVLTATQGWLVEYVTRRWGARTRNILGLSIFAVIAAIMIAAPSQGSSLFGLGNRYITAITNADEPATLLTSLTLIAIAFTTITIAGVRLCQSSLGLPVAVTTSSNDKRSRTLSTRPSLALTQVLIRQAARTPEVYRPVLTIGLLAAPAVWITAGGDAALSTLVMATPLAVVLAWTSNAFGIIGPGMTWLATQPHVMRLMPRLITVSTLISIAVLSLFVLVPPAVIGRMEPSRALSSAAGITIAALLTTRSGLTKAITKPHLARLSGRGDTALPPFTAINYTLRFSITGGIIGWIALAQTDPTLQWGLVALVFVWTAIRYWYLMTIWSDRREQARVTATVSAT